MTIHKKEFSIYEYGNETIEYVKNFMNEVHDNEGVELVTVMPIFSEHFGYTGYAIFYKEKNT